LDVRAGLMGAQSTDGGFMRTRWARRRVAQALLLPFITLVSGATEHAQAQSAQGDPAQFLRRQAERLPISAEARARLKAAAEDVAATRAKRALRQAEKAEERAVRELRQAADELDGLQAEAGVSAAGENGAAARDRVAQVRARVAALRDAVRASLGDEATPELEAAFDDGIAAVLDDLARAEAAATAEEAAAARGRAAEKLRANALDRPAQPLDPNRLPFRTASETTREPRLTNAEFGTSEAGTDEPLAATALAAAAAEAATPDLAPTVDAQITPEIQALAASLDHDPRRIYEWVRNNVAFLPTYGSVQGSHATWQARRGNAFDTSSLLVALLRAAGVPARYVIGTIEVPVAPLTSWLGGVADARMAQQLLGQGGIPNVGLIRGTAMTHVRLEHVWVEAFVDYVPGRGAAHRAGDTWVPLDPSFKLADITPPSGVLAAVPFDLQALSDALLATGEYDPATTRFANVDQQVVFDFWQAWQEQVNVWVAEQGLPNTSESLFGTRAIAPRTSPVIAASLPYTVVARGAGQAALPDSLRHSVTLRGYASSFARMFGDESFTYRLSLPELNSRRLGLTFPPATATDAAILENARNANAASLPVYRINVVPTVTLDGATVASGPAARMGTLTPVDVVLDGPDGPTTVAYEHIAAGDEIVFGITGNGVSEDAVRARFNAVPPDTAAEYLHQVQLHYWAESDALAEGAADSLGVRMLRLPSVGLFASPLTVSYLFGSPVSGVYQSRIMDVKHSLLGAAGPERARVTEFIMQAGYRGSIMEAVAFDQFEPDPERKSISAVQLIADSVTVGIPVYHVTPANAATVVPLLALDAPVMSDIRNAVAAGKSVLVPQRNLDRGTWRGVGYIVQDEETGAGAYLISGGAAGGGLFECHPWLIPVLVIILIILIILIWIFLRIPIPIPRIPIPAPAFTATASATTAAADVPRVVYLLTVLEAMLLTTSRVPVGS
jgi:transglutaminase-like putative cysteine protease